MLKLKEVKMLIMALKQSLPAEERYAVLTYLVSMVEREASDLGKILAQEERELARAGYQQASGS
ncbi:hypothetical protein [Pararhizobium sp. O133]|uniref:hypothetical protein n=1 Tax=Pararhizobium sp. O133 TaxID=3449278 RepID=UPI003F683636